MLILRYIDLRLSQHTTSIMLTHPRAERQQNPSERVCKYFGKKQKLLYIFRPAEA